MSAAAAPKLDNGKAPLHLIAPDFKFGLARVLAFGAKKYSAWSWTKGKEWSRDLAAIHRHLDQWAGGEDLDPETGESHLLHAGCDIMFLFVSWLRGLGTDDRHKFSVATAVESAALEHPQMIMLSTGRALHAETWRAGGCAVCGKADRLSSSRPHAALPYAHNDCWAPLMTRDSLANPGRNEAVEAIQVLMATVPNEQ